MTVPFDLNQFRRPTGDKKLQGELLKQQLTRTGLLCPCGNRIERDGVKLVAVWTGLAPVPTPRGPQLKDMAAVSERAYCGRSCAEFMADRQNGLPFTLDVGLGAQDLLATNVVAVVDLPAITWLTAAVKL